MSDEKRELNNEEETVASGFGSPMGDDDPSSGASRSADNSSESAFGASEADPSADAFGAFPTDGESDTDGVYYSDPLHREEIVTEHLDELPDVENVEELIGDGHVYDEETAGALVALMFAKEHQTEEDQSYAAEYADTVAGGTGQNGSQYGTEYGREGGWSDGFSGTNIRVVDPPKKNKLGWIIAVILAAIALIVTVASLERCGVASDEPRDFEFIYSNNYDGTVTLTEYRGAGGVVYVPDFVDNMAVTAISPGAFSGNDDITEIYLPSSISRIESYSFKGCEYLVSIYVPEGVERIESYAFSDCSRLSAVSLPSSLVEIGSSAFENCTSLTGLSIPEGVVSIGSGAFFNCRGLVWIELPDSLSNIYENAFANCDGLITVYVPSVESLFDINYYSEYSNPLTSAQYLYCDGYLLDSITVPDNVTAIKDYAFLGFGGLDSFTLHDGVYSIGKSAFEGCDLDVIFIPSSVNYIGNGAFRENPNLYIFTPLTYEPSGWQYGWEGGSSISWGVSSTNVVDGFEYRDDGNSITIISCDGANDFAAIPASIIGKPVTAIADYAFADRTGVRSLYIPDSVTHIGSYAFEGCYSLEEVVVPDSVLEIGNGAFAGCISLERITLPFIGAKKNPVSGEYTYPLGYIFGRNSYDGCVMTGQNNYLLGTNTYSSDYYYIPASLKEVTLTKGNVKKGAFLNCDCITKIVLPEDATAIESEAFYKCISLVTLDIPKTVASIGDSAFADCASLSSVRLPRGLSTVGSYAYEDCIGLLEIYIPDTVTFVNDYAFSGCENLTVYCEADESSVSWSDTWNCDGRPVEWGAYIPSPIKDFVYYGYGDGLMIYGYFGSESEIYIPDKIDGLPVKYISNSFASENQTLTRIHLPDSVVEIGERAFENCRSISSVSLGSGLNSIGYRAFAGCTSLTEITIPKSVEIIVGNAFSGCDSLTIYCEANRQPLGWEAGWNSSERPVTWGCYYSTDASGVTYVETDGEITVTGCVGDPSVILIPASIGDYPVTKIDSRAFYGYTGLLKIFIPESVVYIGEHAFTGCYNLTIYAEADSFVTHGFADSWNSSGCNSVWNYDPDDLEAAFTYYGYEDGVMISGYDGIRADIEIPYTLNGKTVLGIGDRAFEGYTHITSVNLPDGLTRIGSYAFNGCTSLVTVNIPVNVTEIADGAFFGCTALDVVYYNARSMTAPNPANAIWGGVGDYAMGGTTLIISADVEEIPSYAFARYNVSNNITAVEFAADSRCTVIGDSAFKELDMLWSVTLGDSVVSIGEYAFYSCDRLESLTLNEGLEEISRNAFAYTGLSEVYLPASVERIAEEAFACSRLKSITVDGANSAYKSVDGNLYSANGTTLLQYAIGKTDSEFSIPDGVSRIAADAFSGASHLTVILLPLGVREIGSCAFESCYNLTEITLPYGVRTIENSAFTYCSRLEKINIPTSVSTLDNAAFHDCTALTIYCEAESQPASWHHEWNISGCPVLWGYYEESPVSDFQYYESGDGITVYKYIGTESDVIIPEIIDGKPVTAIYDEAFFGMSEIVRVRIPDTVMSIGAEAFTRCQSLIGVNMPTSLVSIGSRAFSYCGALARPELPNGLETIGDQAFLYCSSLNDVIIPATVTYVGDRAFQGCGYLTLRCEAETLPSGWHADWNYDSATVEWGYVKP